MKSFFIISLLCFSAIVLGSCTSPDVKRRLECAEGLMYAESDSALRVLDGIPEGFSGGRGDKARYALLMTEARYKNDVVETDDSLIRVAVKYFSRHQESLDRVKAYYYLGIVEANRENYGEAIVALLHAEKTAKLLENHLWLGRIYRSIGDSFDAVWDNASALDYYKLSLDEFLADGENEYIGYAMHDYARGLFRTFRYEDAIAASERTLERAAIEKRELLTSIALRPKIEVVYTRKSVLKRKIKASDAVDKEEFLSYFE